MLKRVKRIKLGKQVYRRLMKKVLERDGWRCQRCGSLENLQVHHRMRRSQQGDDALANLITLCAHCHMRKHGQLYFGMWTWERSGQRGEGGAVDLGSEAQPSNNPLKASTEIGYTPGGRKKGEHH